MVYISNPADSVTIAAAPRIEFLSGIIGVRVADTVSMEKFAFPDNIFPLKP